MAASRRRSGTVSRPLVVGSMLVGAVLGYLLTKGAVQLEAESARRKAQAEVERALAEARSWEERAKALDAEAADLSARLKSATSQLRTLESRYAEAQERIAILKTQLAEREADALIPDDVRAWAESRSVAELLDLKKRLTARVSSLGNVAAALESAGYADAAGRKREEQKEVAVKLAAVRVSLGELPARDLSSTGPSWQTYLRRPAGFLKKTNAARLTATESRMEVECPAALFPVFVVHETAIPGEFVAEATVLYQPAGKPGCRFGLLHRSSGRTVCLSVPPERWSRVRIARQGGRLRGWVDGVEVPLSRQRGAAADALAGHLMFGLLSRDRLTVTSFSAATAAGEPR